MSNMDLGSDMLELISFRVGEQEYCLDIMAVREIRGWTPATSLPHSPPFVRGVINLRGAVLPILDLKARLGLGAAAPDARSVIIVVHIGTRLVGLLVDAVSEILATERASVQPTPNVGCDTVSRFVQGIITQDGRMSSWIALDDILPAEELASAA
ncbi:chemotaxis protein CheW [Candidatus Viadribacter manganicus]|uniref:Chemotaxis protein CheW n=1 Tax=Candidatus Viadribacter manganicus TaxID=1759059 RepID=A0A1B1AGJ6_9PROT|nr:chemotaxis protein CheW [Candidatus Viadribacter manganicus]ANP45677.1 chemotaxis protein CheW [Candidatus Viadribacter manganicus]